jgi:thiol-disulfide isomerase/thioredoxin
MHGKAWNLSCMVFFKGGTVKKVLIGLLIAGMSLQAVPPAEPAGKGPPKKGETLPVFHLPVPKDPAHRGYLGLSVGDTFTIPKIKAGVVIVEIFSMYCPYCQREAPTVNLLYQKIADNPKLRDNIKLIGIGAGNSAFEVGIFRQQYTIPFPLFPDEDYSIHQRIGEVRTPYFIVVKVRPDGSHTVIYSELGGLKDVDHFLRLIVDLSGLTKEG